MDSLGWSWSGSAVLFDLDGTLVDSEASVVRAWRWAAAELDQPFSAFAPYIHGIPASQVLQLVVPSIGAEQQDSLTTAMLARQSFDTVDVVAVPGALAALDVLPTASWAIVTSANQELALARIRAAGLPLPRVLITSEATTAGKPAPEPFLAGAARLGVPIQQCLVVEDSAAGVAAGRAAGCPVLGLLTSSQSLTDTSFAVADLSEVGFFADRLGVSARHQPQNSQLV